MASWSLSDAVGRTTVSGARARNTGGPPELGILAQTAGLFRRLGPQDHRTPLGPNPLHYWKKARNPIVSPVVISPESLVRSPG